MNLSPHSPLSNISFIHLSSQNFCGRNDRLVQQNFSLTTQLLSILLPHIRVIHCPLLGLCCCWYCACGRFIEHSAFLHHKEKLLMTCKSRGFGAACRGNGMRTGCPGQGRGGGIITTAGIGGERGSALPKANGRQSNFLCFHQGFGLDGGELTWHKHVLSAQTQMVLMFFLKFFPQSNYTDESSDITRPLFRAFPCTQQNAPATDWRLNEMLLLQCRVYITAVCMGCVC